VGITGVRADVLKALPWTVALAVAALGPVPLWRGSAALVALIAAVAIPDRRLRVAILAAGAAPIALPSLWPAHPIPITPVVWALLAGGAALAAIDDDRRWRLAVAGGALAIGAIAAIKQEIAATVLPAASDVAGGLLTIGWLAAALALGTPSERAGAVGLVVPAVMILGLGAGFGELLAAMPTELAAEVVAERQADGWWPAIEERALAEVERGELAGPLAVVRLAPARIAVGQALARRYGAELPASVGWEPTAGVDPPIALELASRLDSAGHRDRAIDLLRHQPREGDVAAALAGLALAEWDDALAVNAWSHAPKPPETTPGMALLDVTWTSNAEAVVGFSTDAPLAGIDVSAVGTSYDGPPELTLALIADGGVLRTGPIGFDGPAEHGWDLALPAGSYLLHVRFGNDASGPSGDRNLEGLRITVR
jgi:hypothetical protein